MLPVTLPPPCSALLLPVLLPVLLLPPLLLPLLLSPPLLLLLPLLLLPLLLLSPTLLLPVVKPLPPSLRLGLGLGERERAAGLDVVGKHCRPGNKITAEHCHNKDWMVVSHSVAVAKLPG